MLQSVGFACGAIELSTLQGGVQGLKPSGKLGGSVPAGGSARNAPSFCLGNPQPIAPCMRSAGSDASFEMLGEPSQFKPPTPLTPPSPALRDLFESGRSDGIHTSHKLKLYAANFQHRFDDPDVKQARKLNADIKTICILKSSNSDAAVYTPPYVVKTGFKQPSPSPAIDKKNEEENDETFLWFMRPSCINPMLLDVDPTWKANSSLWDDDGHAHMPLLRKRNVDAKGSGNPSEKLEKRKVAAKARPKSAQNHRVKSENDITAVDMDVQKHYMRKRANAVALSLPTFLPVMPNSILQLPQSPTSIFTLEPASPVLCPSTRPRSAVSRLPLQSKNIDHSMHARLPHLRRTASMFPASGLPLVANRISTGSEFTSSMSSAQNLRALRGAVAAAISGTAVSGPLAKSDLLVAHLLKPAQITTKRPSRKYFPARAPTGKERSTPWAHRRPFTPCNLSLNVCCAKLVQQ